MQCRHSLNDLYVSVRMEENHKFCDFSTGSYYLLHKNVTVISSHCIYFFYILLHPFWENAMEIELH